MNDESAVVPGEYLHYKGGVYEVLHTAVQATNDAEGRTAVVYRSRDNGVVYVRDTEEFLESVQWPDGGMRPRFLKNTLK